MGPGPGVAQVRTKAQILLRENANAIDRLMDVDVSRLNQADLDEWMHLMSRAITRSYRIRHLVDVEWLLIQYVPVYLASWVVLLVVFLDDSDTALTLVLCAIMAMGTVLIGLMVRDYVRRRKAAGL